jgi:hypothetical protein
MDNPITRKLLFDGEIKKGGVFVIYKDGTMMAFKVKITKIIKSGDDVILKLKTGKDYPLGHKYIFRSLDELVGGDK